VNRADKAIRIQQILDALYSEPPIPLDHEDAFTLLVAVLMSAQTTDVQVNRVTPGLFALASTPTTMAELGERGVLQAIKTCGLAPTKAKNIVRLSQMLITEHGGVVPDDLATLETLPGVGHKTASVVMCQAFGRQAFPVDTHIHRLAARWGLSNGKNVVQTERDLKKVFPEQSWAKLHLQIIYFGREHCPAQRHDLSSCAICGWAATKKRMRLERRSKAGKMTRT
jgi:endonuclease-3